MKHPRHSSSSLGLGFKKRAVLLLALGCWQPGCPSRSPESAKQLFPAAPVDTAAPEDAGSAALSLESLGARLVKDDVGKIRRIDLSRTNVCDDDLALLRRISSVEVLLLGSTSITDEGLVHLRNAPSLAFVDLSNTKVTNEGIETLRELKSLRALQLHGTRTSAQSFRSWEGLQSPDALQWLTPSYAALRARGLTHDEERELRQREVHDYERIVEKHPKHLESLYRLGTQRLALERLWDTQDLTRRDQLLRLAILELRRLTSLISESDPAATRMRAYHQLGRAWKHLGDFQLETGSARETASQSYQAALQAFRQVLRIDPDQVDALGEIVLVYLALDDRLSGLAAVRKHLSATQSPPSRAKTHVMLGELLARNGEFDEAISNLKSAIEADGGAMDAYMVLFRIFAKRNDPESAIRLLRRAVETEPTFLSGHLQLGQLLAGQDRIDEAINSFEALLRVPPTEAVVLGMVPSPNVFRNQLYYRAASWLAWLYLDTNDDPERALQAVKTAKQYGPADAHLLDTEGLIFLKQGKYRKARDLLGQTAKELETPTALYHLAQAHFALGEWYESVKCLQQALAGDTAFADRAAATKLLNQTREKLVSQADRPQP